MKVDLFSLMHILFIVISFAAMFSYIVYSYRKLRNSFSKSNLSYIRIKILNYTRKLFVKDYQAYEKYDIWRFCTLF